MTREEAIIILGNIPINGDECYSIAEYQEAKTMAIEALKQEPNEDCISREHALEPYKILEDTDTLSVYTIRQNLAELPSVTPQEPKTGHWKRIGKRGEYAYICSQCNHESIYNGNFCPNCGAEMKEGDA